MWLKRYVEAWCKLSAETYNFADVADLQRFLQNELIIENYNVAFSILQNNMPLDETTAKNMCLQALFASPQFDRYQMKLEQMQGIRNENPAHYSPVIEYDDAREALVFEHADAIIPIDITPFGGKAAPPYKPTQRGKAKRDQRQEEKRQELANKLEAIGNTDDETYMTHVNQCGYLANHTKMRFWFLPGSKMWGTSVMTHIGGITLDQLRNFIDATGEPTLAGIDIRSEEFRRERESVGEEEFEQTPNGIMATHMKFASELMNFMNLEFVVDPYGIAAQLKSTGGDTKFQPISEWGATPDVILKRLSERKPELDPEDIKEYFMEGYQGTLLD